MQIKHKRYTELEIREIIKEKLILVLTASKKEYKSVLSLLEPLDNIDHYCEVVKGCAKFVCGSLEGCPVVAVQQKDQGSVLPNAAINTLHEAVDLFNIELVVSLGVCFSLSQENHELGDVIVSTSVTNYETVVVEGTSQLKDGASIPCNFLKGINQDSILSFQEDLGFNIHIGETVSGEKLINDNRFIKILSQTHSEALAGDMELAGVASFCKNKRISWLCVKGVSDYGAGDKSKEDTHADVYALNAALVFRKMLGVNKVCSLIDSCKEHDYYKRMLRVKGKRPVPYSRLGGEDVVSIELPKAIKKSEHVKDNANRIHFEYVQVDYPEKDDMGFLFLGRDITISQTANFFSDNFDLPKKTLMILTPRVSGESGDSFRVREVEKKFKELRFPRGLNVKYAFLEDYLWDLTIGRSAEETEEYFSTPYFIDQPIYLTQAQNHMLADSGVERMAEIINEKNTTENPIIALLGEGGVGKSTFCKQLATMLSSNDDVKAFYLANESYSWPAPDGEIGTLKDLYIYFTKKVLQFENAIDENELLLNMQCGNVVLIVDGIDEIDSALGPLFDFSTFVESIAELNKSFNKCKIILAAREYYAEKCVGHEGIKSYYLRGFTEVNADTYFGIRFNDLPGLQSQREAKTEAFRILGLIGSEEPYNPLYADLAAEIVRRGGSVSEDFDDISSDYLWKNETIDQFIFSLLNRENRKQFLKADIDDLVDLLLFVCIDNKGVVSDAELTDYLQYSFDEYIDEDVTILDKFKKSPFLLKTNDTFVFKYSCLVPVLSARLFVSLVNKGSYNDPRYVQILSDNHTGVGEFVDILSPTKLLDSDKNTQVFQKIFKHLSSVLENGDAAPKKHRDAISGLIQLAVRSSSAKDKEDRTSIIINICGKEARFFSLSGSFFPLIFNELRIIEGQLSRCPELFRSDFPSHAVIINSTVNLSTPCDFTIPAEIFDPDCKFNKHIEDAISTHTKKEESTYGVLKGDLLSVCKCFYNSGRFRSLSRNVIKKKSVINSKYSFEEFLKKLTKFGLLQKDKEIFSIKKDYYSDVVRLCTENNMNQFLGKIIKDLNS